MSALGQKQTCALQNVMSALHPIATAKANSSKRPCPLYPQKRTCAVHKLMSALGQKRTHAHPDLLALRRGRVIAIPSRHPFQGGQASGTAIRDSNKVS